MDEKKTMIRVSGVSKQYRLGQIGGGTLQSDLQSWWARLRGKEDPNLPVGQLRRLDGSSFLALDGIDLTIHQGEAVGIIGNNGAGKSTLLKLLSRVTAPTSGNIDLYGRVSSMLEIGTGFSGQMTGRENIYMNGAILGMSKREIDEKLERIIEFSEVRDFIDTPVKRYSSGMFVKLAFAVAAHLNSEIIIMDEVLAVGDVAFQKKCLEKMKSSAHLEGKTVLYVSHNMNTIRELCDRCIVLDQGRVIFDGDVDRGISLYLNNAIQEHAVELDLTGKTLNRTGSLLSMKHLTLADKISPIYDNREALKMRFRLSVEQPLHRVQLRLTVRTEDDRAVGTAWSVGRDFLRPGEVVTEYEFPLEPLVEGLYYVSVGFYQMNDLGCMRTLDHVTRAFRMEVQPKISIQNWSIRAHGCVRFPDIK